MTVYEERLTVLKKYLQKENVQAALIHDPENVFYYTGFLSDPHERFMGLIIDVERDELFFFVPALDYDAAVQATNVERIIPISDEELPFEVIRTHLPELKGTFGLEARAINYERYLLLTETFPSINVENIQMFINEQRKKKSPYEISKLKEALRIIERVFEEGLKDIKIGMTELELTSHLEVLMRQFGADSPSFSSIVLTGEKAALPHGTPGERTIQHGDFLLIDFGVIKDGYCSDITRTFVIGEADEKQKEIYHIVKRATAAGVSAVRAGVPLKTFDAAARSIIEEAGYGEYFNNRVGHGLGIGLHEEPSVHSRNEEIAQPGYVFTIEPGIYIPGWGGIRIEDTVYINDRGEGECLSSYTRELIELEVK